MARLNLHPDLYVTYETDIIWILYHLYEHRRFQFYPLDLPHSTVHTLRSCVAILNRTGELSPSECYWACQSHLVTVGTPWMKPIDRKVNILGDKKPNQHSEPYINDWLAEYFPNARYVHIVRHPYDFVRSVPRLPNAFDLGACYGSPGADDLEKVIAAWTYFEQRVLEEKAKERFPIYTVRFEDFTVNPGPYLGELWRFCGLTIPSELQARIDAGDTFDVQPGGRHTHLPAVPFSVNLPPETVRLMELYGYAP